MLCLTLRRGRTIDITLEDGRRITIKGIDNEVYEMSIGIDAPRTIMVDRGEVRVRKEAELARGQR